MATLGELVIRINADISGLQRGLDRSTGAIRRMNAEMASLGRSLTIGVTLPIAALGLTVGRAAADMDGLRRGLEAVAGSADAAKEQLKRLEDVAKLPGLGFREAIQGSIRLQAVGISVALAERSLRSFGNAVALTGGGKVELDRITYQLGQLAAKGKVLGNDLRPIIEAAPAVGKALREAFGTVDPETIQKLGLTSEQFLTRLLDSLDKLPRVTGGVKNSFENLTDSLFRAKVAIGEALLPAIVPLVEGLTKALEKVRTLNPETVRWGIAIAAVAAVAGPLILVISSLTTAVAALAGAFAIGLLPMIVIGGPILIGLGLLAALFVKNKLEALAAGDAIDRFKNSLAGMSQALLSTGIQQRTVALVNLESARVRTLADLNAARAQLDTLQRQAPSTFGQKLTGTGRYDLLGRERPGMLPTPAGFDPRNIEVAQERVTRLATQLTNLGGEAERVRSEFRQMGEQFNATLGPATTQGPLPTPAAGRDKLAGLMDGLTDRLRELRALQKFAGVPSISLLPDDAQEQIRILNSLSGELDTLQDGLERFRSAGRAPPAGLTWGIDLLTTQIDEAQKKLDRLATLFNDPRLLGNANIRLPDMNIGQITGGMQVEPRRGAGFEARGEAPMSFMKEFASGVKGMLAGLGPMALALQAVNAVLEPLQPLIDALLVPFTLVGEMLAIAVVPVLRILWPIIKAVAIVFSYLQEATDRIIGGILWAAGAFVKGMGKLINAITPLANPGNPLIKAGEAIQKAGGSFTDAAKEIAKRRKELEKLSFDDALDKTREATDKLTESMLNAVQGFKIARYRFDALSAPGATAGAIPSASNVSAAPAVTAGDAFVVQNVHLHAAPGEDIEEVWKKLKALILRESRHKITMRQLAAMVT